MQFRQSQPDAALAQYQAALESVLAQRQNAAIRLHTRRGYTFIQLRDLDFAWGEALLARARPSCIRARCKRNVAITRGKTHYVQALDCTQQANHAELQALAHYQLGSLAMRWNAWKMRRRICTSACITMRRLATACN